MSRPPYWVSRMPVLSTAHVTQPSLEWLQNGDMTGAQGTAAPYPEGAFLYFGISAAGLPDDLAALRGWVTRRRYGWIRLDADGDVVDGLPVYAW